MGTEDGSKKRVRVMEPKERHHLPYGEGSFYYSQQRGLWVGTIEAGWNENGRRRRISVSDRNEDKAWAKLTKKRKAILKDGVPAEGATENTTVKVWCSGWIERRQADVKPKTFLSERSVINKWVIPTLGHRKVADLTPGDLRKLTDKALREGSSITNARYIQRIFQQSLKDAKLEGLKVPAPALEAKKPAIAVTDRKDIPWDEAEAILRQARDTLPHWSRWALAFRLGLRQGEALGLTWDEVDLASNTISVAWQLQELTKVDGKYVVPAQYEARQLTGRYHLMRPKSRAGWRSIPMTPAAKALLQDWKTRAYKSPYGLVWPTVDGLPRPNKADRREWQKLQEAVKVAHPAGRQYHVHEIRHSTVAFLLKEGVQTAVIEAIVGHSKLVTNYVHVDEEMKLAGLAAIES